MFVCSGFALFALIVGTNMPSPFYAVYAERFDFSPLTLTLIFAAYTGALIPTPTRTTYLIEVGVLLLAAVGLFSLPADLGRTGAHWHPRLPQIPQIPAQKRAFFTACAVSFTGWAVTAVFLSIVPTYVTTLTGNDSLLVAGMAAGLVLVVAAAIQPVVAHLRGDTLERSGLMALALGLVALLVAGITQSIGVVLASAVIAGVGQGMGFMGAMRQSADAAPDGTEAATASAFYVATYAGVGLPTIGVGFLATWLGTVTAVDIFAGVILVLSVGVVCTVQPVHADN